MNYAEGEDMPDFNADEIMVTGPYPSDGGSKSNVPPSQPQDHNGSETLK